MIERQEGTARTYLSTDLRTSTCENSEEDEIMYNTEFLNTLTEHS